MLLSENSFRLWSVGLLGILIISMTAFAEKSQVTEEPIFSIVNHIEEAEKINDGQFHASKLTTTGSSTEVVSVPPLEKN